MLADLPQRWFRISVPALAIERFCLQLAHRLGSVGMLLNLASWGLLYVGRDTGWPLTLAFLCSDVAFCAALTAWLLARRENRGGEALAATIFNLIFLILSLQLMVIGRLDVIRSAASQFFSPT